jgi:molybdopterin converting factor subunit 1
MKLHVRLFAAARQLADREMLTVECPEGTTVAQLRAAISGVCPELQTLLAHARIAVNTQYAADDQVLAPSDEIACIPPVSGG